MSLPESNGKTILITGITGYVASIIGHLLLTKGYSLRGTTRKLASAEPLLNGPYAIYESRVKIFEVPDMTIDGAYDDAAKGVNGILHTAAPVSFTLDTYDDFVVPTLRGSEVLLNSALKAGPQLSSVVYTSSIAAVIEPSADPDHDVYTEDTWAYVKLENEIKNKEAGLKSHFLSLYPAGKTAAERAVWKFRDDHKPAFAISVINPSICIGPPVVQPSSPSQLTSTLIFVYNILSGTWKSLPPDIDCASWVDVRDVAFMHVWALENPEKADGERFLADCGRGPLQAITDVLHHKYRGTKLEENMVVGEPGKGYVGYNKETKEVDFVDYPPNTARFDGSKAERVMGFTYRPFRKAVEDTADVLEKLLYTL